MEQQTRETIAKHRQKPQAATQPAAFVLLHTTRAKEVMRGMGSNGVSCAIKKYKKLTNDIDKLRSTPETVLKRTASDFKKRAPGWISTEVSKVYAIKKADVGTRGNVKVNGNTTKEVAVQYTGRLLTPATFKMTPREPKPAYTLKAEIIKGKKSTLGKVKKITPKQRKEIGKNFRKQGTRRSDHSPIMLMKMGNNMLPFQRRSFDRMDIHGIKTVSVPQMVSNEKVMPGINTIINDQMGKRIAHHMKLMEK